jgi:fructose-bisphosphate aldolase class II
MRKVCMARFTEFGSAGHADKIKAFSTATMAKRYSSGVLHAKFGAEAGKVAAE